MRTKCDFDRFYKSGDPWGVNKYDWTIRDRVIYEVAWSHAKGKFVLEIGCGEGNHTRRIFSEVCSRVFAVDISEVAISRLRELKLKNVTYLVDDMLHVDLDEKYEVIFALECLYYLSSDEQEEFWLKLKNQARGKLFVMSCPIIGANEHRRYFRENDLVSTFEKFGFNVIESRNISFKWSEKTLDRVLFNVLRLAEFIGLLNPATIQLLPDGWVYQKIFVIRI